MVVALFPCLPLLEGKNKGEEGLVRLITCRTWVFSLAAARLVPYFSFPKLATMQDYNMSKGEQPAPEHELQGLQY